VPGPLLPNVAIPSIHQIMEFFEMLPSLYNLPLFLAVVAADRGRHHPGTAGGQRQVPHHERPRRIVVVVVGVLKRVRLEQAAGVGSDDNDKRDGHARHQQEGSKNMLRPFGRRCFPAVARL